MLASKTRKKITWEQKFENKEQFGDLPIMDSRFENKVVLTKISDLTDDFVGKEVTLRARVHRRRELSKETQFFVLREKYDTVQVVLNGKEICKFGKLIGLESIVEAWGKVVKVKDPTSTTKPTIEVQVDRFYVVNAAETCPMLVEDAMKSEKEIEEENKKIEELIKQGKKGKKPINVGLDVRLNNRVLDLRAPAHVAIFKVQSTVGFLFREFLIKKGFTEIHSPKLISTASEGGADIFEVKYFNKKAYLAQSPQLYKQMAIMCDWERVFEVGPVFRAEKSFTNRHLTEFVGLDLEMKLTNHYHEALEVLDGLFVHIFKGLNKMCKKELEIINKQYPFEPLVFREKNLVLEYKEGIKMLKEAGVKDIGDYDDLSTPNEKLLGKLVKEKYNTDFYILDKFPMDARPFYTMPDPKNPKYSNSYDIFLRGEEITSGAQRIHDPKLLLQKAKEKEVDLTPIMDYVNSFKHGAWPHAGAGIGLERVVMLFLGLPNVRKGTMFPRDPKRLNP